MGVEIGIKKKLGMALSLYRAGKHKECDMELTRVERAYPFNSVREAFYEALEKMTKSKK